MMTAAALSDLGLSDPEMSVQSHSYLNAYISEKVTLWHMLLFTTNRKSYMECPFASSGLSLSDLGRLALESLIFQIPAHEKGSRLRVSVTFDLYDQGMHACWKTYTGSKSAP